MSTAGLIEINETNVRFGKCIHCKESPNYKE